MKRRGLAAGALAGVAAIALCAYRARYVNPYAPRLERLTLRLPAGHARLAGLTIGFVTDTHVGPSFSARDLARGTALVGAARPDLVLLGGDYISESPRFATDAARVLGRLAAVAPLGAYAVLGNHDTFTSAAKVTRALREAGIRVLRNEAAAIPFQGDTLWIAGIDDAHRSLADPARAFSRVPPGSAVLALWHEPDHAEQCAALGAFAQLSGHSHGGQVRLPGLGALGLPPGGRRHVIGLNEVAGMPVYTSRGLGVYRPPARLNCPPEVTLITLSAAAG